MSIRLEKWHNRYWIVTINEDLYPTKIDKNWKPPLIAHWGKDIYGDTSKEKLMYVWYPKNKYTEKDIEYITFTERKYDSCPMCLIGRDIINKKLNFRMGIRELYEDKVSIKELKDIINKKSMANKSNLSYFIVGGIIALPFILFGIKYALDKR